MGGSEDGGGMGQVTYDGQGGWQGEENRDLATCKGGGQVCNKRRETGVDTAGPLLLATREDVRRDPRGLDRQGYSMETGGIGSGDGTA